MDITTLSIAQRIDIFRRRDPLDFQFTASRFQLNTYERDVMPAVIGRLLNFGIEKAAPRWMVGCVRSFDVVPFARADPVIIVCSKMNLVDYYLQWTRLLRCNSYEKFEFVVDYDQAIEKAVRSAIELSLDEIHFALCEMLHFRNQMIGRAHE